MLKMCIGYHRDRVAYRRKRDAREKRLLWALGLPLLATRTHWSVGVAV